ncbi:adenylate/guanylate cyclase domain-containing protein [Ruegeria hyattellae]|uniref:adenylate/guanylate cyclase domain-containing protein n=1 Tax=Ruegeria hyattellae TaxID=3233337 RepID=UPI00355B825D
MQGSADILSKLAPDALRAALRLMEYMLVEGTKAQDADEVLTSMSERIRAAGVPLDRATSIVPLLHAEAVASARFWERGQGARSYMFPYNEDSGKGYARSPAAKVHDTGEWEVLWLPDTADDTYEIVLELKEAGYIHYAMAPVFMRNGMASTFSFATRARGGFSEAHLAFLHAVFPALAACQELLATHRAMSESLRMYVGEEPQRRIISGDVHRGEVMHIRSAILFADMRRFTELTSSMSAEAATQFLNDYFDCIIPAVEENGGEVLKLIGDGVLAIFRADEDGRETCARALLAASEGLRRVAERGEFEVGIALHFGEVAYGNVGSGMRLDYTVVGRDVNIAARIAALCSSADETLLMSQEFRQRIEREGRSIGAHSLKGIDHPKEIFACNYCG